MLWFKCAAVHDPSRPVIKKPALIGWVAKHRQVDLVLERSLSGEDLLRRMKGWFTVDVDQVIDLIKPHGRLKVLDDRDLVVETKDRAGIKALSSKQTEVFGEEVWIEEIPKTRLE